MPRIPINISYMQVAYQFSKLSYAERRKVGCIIVKDHQVISFGYNGMPHGFDNTCEIDNTTKPEVLHAESNAIMKVAKSTMSCEGAELFTTTCPCFGCAKLIIQAGISKVYYTEDYRDMGGVDLLRQAGIIVEQVNTWNEH
jgi:dCMP deaminase|tara:strand:+ start:374 stop:796 length:423 start_codon:yes stop_codon:yes gene_type:complete